MLDSNLILSGLNDLGESIKFIGTATCGPQTCGCRGSGPTVRIGRVLDTSLSRAQHAHGGGFAGSEV